MLDITLSLSNEEARALASELQRIRPLLVPRMTGEKSDKRDSATPAYAVLDQLLVRIREHLAAIRPPEKRRREHKS